MAVSVTSKGQVTIPKRVREALGITPGTGSIRRRGWWGATQVGQEACLVTGRGGGCDSRLQRPSHSGRQNARWAGDEESREACAPLTRTSLLAITCTTMPCRGVSLPICCRPATSSSPRP